MLYRSPRTHGLWLLLILPLTSQAHQEAVELEEIVVTGRRQVLAGEARTASEGVVGQMDLAIRPLLRPGDVLIRAQAGEGISEPKFLNTLYRPPGSLHHPRQRRRRLRLVVRV